MFRIIIIKSLISNIKDIINNINFLNKKFNKKHIK
jgi:hypothetical protein